MRQERIRREHAGSESANREGVPCSHDEMFELIQANIADHSAMSADELAKIDAWQDKMHRLAQEKGANAR